MRLDKSRIILFGLTLPVHAHPRPKPSHNKRVAADSEKANAVKDAFKTAWEGYHEYAFPHDNLHPVTNGYDDDRLANPVAWTIWSR